MQIQKRTDVTPKPHTKAQDIEVAFSNINEHNRAVFSGVSQLLVSIFKAYRRNRFENNKRLQLTSSYYLLKNITSTDEFFVQSLTDRRSNLIAVFNETLDSIQNKITNDNIDVKSLFKEAEILQTLQNGVQGLKTPADIATDLVSIFEDVLDTATADIKTNAVPVQQSETVTEQDSQPQTQAVEQPVLSEDQMKRLETGGLTKDVTRGFMDGVQARMLELIKGIKVPTVQTQVKGEQKNDGFRGLMMPVVPNIITVQKKISKNTFFQRTRRNFLVKMLKAKRRRAKETTGFFRKMDDLQKKMASIQKTAGSRNPFISKITGTVGNVVSALSWVALPLSIIGHVVAGTVKTALKLVTLVGGPIWKFTKNIVSSVTKTVSDVVSAISKPFIPLLLRFLATSQGGYMLGFMAGTINNKFKEIGVDVKGAFEESVNMIIDVFSGGLDKFQDLFNAIDVFYMRLKMGFYSDEIKTAIDIINKFLSSFTPNGMLKAAGYAALAHGVGGIATGVVAKIFGVSVTTGQWWLSAILAIAGIGAIIWSKFTEYQKDERRQEHEDKTSNEYFETQAKNLQKQRKKVGSWFKPTSGSKRRVNLISEQLKNGQITHGNTENNKLSIVQTQITDSLNDEGDKFEMELNRFELIQQFKEEKLKDFFEEKKSIQDTAFQMSEDNQYTPEQFNHPTIPVAVNLEGTGFREEENLTGLTSTPLSLRVANLKAQMEAFKTTIDEVTSSENTEITKKTLEDIFKQKLRNCAPKMSKMKSGEYFLENGPMVGMVGDELHLAYNDDSDSNETRQNKMLERTYSLNHELTKAYSTNITSNNFTALNELYGPNTKEKKHFLNVIMMDMILGKKTSLTRPNYNIAHYCINLLLNKSIKKKLSKRGLVLTDEMVSADKLDSFIKELFRSNEFTKQMLDVFQIPEKNYSINISAWASNQLISKPFKVDEILFHTGWENFMYINPSEEDLKSFKPYLWTNYDDTYGFCTMVFSKDFSKDLNKQQIRMEGTPDQQVTDQKIKYYENRFVNFILPYMELYLKIFKDMPAETSEIKPGGLIGDIVTPWKNAIRDIQNATVAFGTSSQSASSQEKAVDETKDLQKRWKDMKNQKTIDENLRKIEENKQTISNLEQQRKEAIQRRNELAQKLESQVKELNAASGGDSATSVAAIGDPDRESINKLILDARRDWLGSNATSEYINL